MLRTKLSTLFKDLFVIEHGHKNIRAIATSLTRCRDVVDRREMLRSMPKPDEGAVGEKTIDVDAAVHVLVLLITFYQYFNLLHFRLTDRFPTIDTPNKLFNGTAFKDLPIFNIRVTPNNTIISLTDAKGNFNNFVCL